MLANPRRLMILWSLVERERSVGELAQAIGASLQSTSQHLRLMREHGMVCARRDGQTIYYQIAGAPGAGKPQWLKGLVPRPAAAPLLEGETDD